MAVERLSQASILTLQKYNSMVAGYSASGDYELISTQVLASTASGVTFSNLASVASSYKHLQIRSVIRGSGADAGNEMGCYLRVNADTGANYTSHMMYGQGSSVTSFYASGASATSIPFWVVSSTTTANSFTMQTVDLPDAFNTSKNKTLKILQGNADPSINRVIVQSGTWMSTASVSSLTLSSAAAGFVAGSRFSLYGLRA